MSSPLDKLKFWLGTVVVAVLWAFGGSFVAGFAGLVIGIGFDMFGMSFGPGDIRSASLTLFATGLSGGALVGAIAALATQVAGRSRDRRSRVAAAQRAVDDKRRQQEQRLQQLRETMDSSCTESAALFERLPEDIENTRSWYAEAAGHFAMTAYSPFWHAIENAYQCLAMFNQRLARIDELSRNYQSARRAYFEAGGDGLVPEFPVRVNDAKAADVASKAAAAVHEQVYQAQRDPHFAQIWEQRRTTAAVIAGFANLESAVSQMASALGSSLDSLGVAVRSLSADMASTSESTRQAAGAASEQLRAQRELNERVEKTTFQLRHELKRIRKGW